MPCPDSCHVTLGSRVQLIPEGEREGLFPHLPSGQGSVVALSLRRFVYRVRILILIRAILLCSGLTLHLVQHPWDKRRFP